jgi:hypothetical protein
MAVTSKKFYFLFVVLLTIVITIIAIIYVKKNDKFYYQLQVEKNYGDEINKAAEAFDIDRNYLKALCLLESSGELPAGKRFEKKVYNDLKQLRARKIKKYSGLTPAMIKNASDEALKNLATSWGPFQLMGYQCLLVGVKVQDIRGDSTVYFSVKWIKQTYGDYLAKRRYADAFHIHNTGIPVPKNGKYRTYHPEYVPRGLKLMQLFRDNF